MKIIQIISPASWRGVDNPILGLGNDGGLYILSEIWKDGKLIGSKWILEKMIVEAE